MHPGSDAEFFLLDISSFLPLFSLDCGRGRRLFFVIAGLHLATDCTYRVTLRQRRVNGFSGFCRPNSLFFMNQTLYFLCMLTICLMISVSHYTSFVHVQFLLSLLFIRFSGLSIVAGFLVVPAQPSHLFTFLTICWPFSDCNCSRSVIMHAFGIRFLLDLTLAYPCRAMYN